MRDVEQGNNQQLPVIPQVLVANADELSKLVAIVIQNGYGQLNLNLGCPYPMATNKGRGTGLLENADQLKNVLEVLFGEYDLKVSVKLRSGLNDHETCMERLSLINSFPFEKVIFHARTADQMYKGKADAAVFGRFKAGCDHPVVYNGDLFSLKDYLHLKELFPKQKEWMLGRGILMNPFLPKQIKDGNELVSGKNEQLLEFHDLIFQQYAESMDDKGHILNKMQQFWIYFSENFSEPRKVLKIISKTKKLEDYQKNVVKAFNQFLS